MKQNIFTLATLVWFAIQSGAYGQGTAFTYQGRLNEGGAPANGIYDLRFAIYNAPAGGNVLGGPVTNAATVISNGLFTVILDFGSSAFAAGAPDWLEFGILPNGSANGFTTLNPRQLLTATPYAITAGNVSGGINGTTISNGTITASKIATNQVVTSLNKLRDDVTLKAGLNIAIDVNTSNGTNAIIISANGGGGAGAGSNYWQLTGNAGTIPGVNFLGTTDNRALQFHVNSARALRLEPGFGVPAPNVIGGASNNLVGAASGGAAIAGGDNNVITANYAAIAGGTQNAITGDYSAIGGGFGGFIDASAYSTIGGGSSNTVSRSSNGGVIAGGMFNFIEPLRSYATVGGGANNTNAGTGSTIAGGIANDTEASGGTIGGGINNWVSGAYSTISGGLLNLITNSAESFIGGGNENVIQNNADDSTIGGGEGNLIGSSDSTLAGGSGNTIGTNSATTTIAGGLSNSIGNGIPNSTIGGGSRNSIADGSSSGLSGATIAGGDFNAISGNADATISGGSMNTNGSTQATISGGSQNTIGSGSAAAVIGGGLANTIYDAAGISIISGGFQNQIATGATGSSILGGNQNVINGGGSFATVAGGRSNTAGGTNAFAAGQFAQALHNNTFVWSDGSMGNTPGFASSGVNQFLILASHGVGINKNNPNRQYSLDVHGVIYSDGAVLGQNLGASNSITGATISATISVSAPQLYGQLNSGSDRNTKEHFEAVKPVDILERVASLPISTWNFKTEPAVRHIGPMAQDFKAAFDVGIDDKHIGVVDAQGVALAAIQGLNQKVFELNAELKRREVETEELKTRLEALEQLIQQQKLKGNSP